MMMKKGIWAALILGVLFTLGSCAGIARSVYQSADPHEWDETLPADESVWLMVSGGVTAYNGVEVKWLYKNPFGSTNWIRIPPGPTSLVANLRTRKGNIVYTANDVEFSFNFTETGDVNALTGKYYWIEVVPLEERGKGGVAIYLVDLTDLSTNPNKQDNHLVTIPL
jgi:hypothetical protein